MKRVVLLGDSIRVNYQDKVIEKLKGECEVISLGRDNCAYTMHTIRCARDWFNQWGKVDLIHWNNGIWDHHRNAEDDIPFSTPEIYLSLNRRLHNFLKDYADHLIWATTTPGGPKYDPSTHILLTLSREEWNREIAAYNGIVAGYLRTQGVAIDDLYALVSTDPERIIAEDGIHLSEEGKEILAEQVANSIRAKLGL